MNWRGKRGGRGSTLVGTQSAWGYGIEGPDSRVVDDDANDDGERGEGRVEVHEIPDEGEGDAHDHSSREQDEATSPHVHEVPARVPKKQIVGVSFNYAARDQKTHGGIVLAT